MKTVESGTELDLSLISEEVPESLARPLDRGAEGSSSDASSFPPSLRGYPTLTIGELVADRYRVGPVIGAGGMGIVYKAQHVELGTSVAIKVIRPDVARNSSVWRRFSREARALAALHNKHVVRVHDAGTLASGLRYLVMELLDGIDLRRLLHNEGPLPVERAVEYVMQVCSALGDAHRLHIIHRDVKPENIFLAQFRVCEPTIKLLDFGVALFLDDAGQLTMPGRGVGSPHYLSPEQIQNPSAVDQRSDIWAVGLLMFELLTGHSPFHGMSVGKIAMKIVKGPMPKIEDERAGLPRGLSALIQRCLEVDPALRPQSADELIAALEPFSSRHSQAILATVNPENQNQNGQASPSHEVAPRQRVGLVPRLFGWAPAGSH